MGEVTSICHRLLGQRALSRRRRGLTSRRQSRSYASIEYELLLSTDRHFVLTVTGAESSDKA